MVVGLAEERRGSGKADSQGEDLLGVAGAVHHGGTRCRHALGSSWPEESRPDGHARRQRSGCNSPRFSSVGDIQMQLVADPEGAVSLRVSLAAHIAGPGQILQRLAELHALLPFRQTRFLRTLLALARPSPLARLRFGFGAFADFGAGFSRASIAVESRETCPTGCSPRVRSTNASCGRDGREFSANSANVREKVASLGTAYAEDQPQRRRVFPSTSSRSIRSRVEERSKTALAGNACARETRSFAGRPGPGQDPITSRHARTRRYQAAADIDRSATQPSPRRLRGVPVEIRARNAIEYLSGTWAQSLRAIIWCGNRMILQEIAIAPVPNIYSSHDLQKERPKTSVCERRTCQ